MYLNIKAKKLGPKRLRTHGFRKPMVEQKQDILKFEYGRLTNVSTTTTTTAATTTTTTTTTTATTTTTTYTYYLT